MSLRYLLSAAIAAMSIDVRSARACDPAEFLTPPDLVDRAATVAVVEVTAVAHPRGSSPQVTATVVEALKGSPAASLSLAAPGGSCEAGFAVGARGIVFADGAGQVIGLYDGFLTAKLTAWTSALRDYVHGATAADRAAGLVALATSGDWSASFAAAYALGDRVELLLALDAGARARLAARATKLRSADHPIRVVAARLQLAPPHARARPWPRPPAAAAAVAADVFAAESDPAALAARIASPTAAPGLRRRCDLGTGQCFTAAAQARIAALERCERVHGRSLDRFSAYAFDDDPVAWAARAEACRTGVPRAP